jgi:hypothetical protein
VKVDFAEATSGLTKTDRQHSHKVLAFHQLSTEMAQQSSDYRYRRTAE